MTDTDTATRTRITGIGTVAIPVVDQARALEFYVGTLGFEMRMDAEFAPGQRWIEVAPKGASASIALVQARPDYAAGVDTGVRLSTKDATADHEALRTVGVEVGELLPEPIPMFVVQDPDANTLYVVERPAG
jgi:catechol 2,3-dioxygenase-like lactoylglutathione lyase family enzyme